jgi:hypothetical protein
MPLRVSPASSRAAEGLGLLDGRVAGAVEVRGERLDEVAGVLLAGAHEHRGLGESGAEGGAVAALAVDQLVLASVSAGRTSSGCSRPTFTMVAAIRSIAASSKGLARVEVVAHDDRVQRHGSQLVTSRSRDGHQGPSNGRGPARRRTDPRPQRTP